jgi:hypothetical protein
MPEHAGAFLFVTLFVGAAILIFVAARRNWRRWLARPAILRAFAARRGWRAVEKPGAPSSLVPIRPLEQGSNLLQLELPLAVQGMSGDVAITLFDVYTNVKTGSGTNSSYHETFQTFMVFRRGDRPWPHFEFSALRMSPPVR